MVDAIRRKEKRDHAVVRFHAACHDLPDHAADRGIRRLHRHIMRDSLVPQLVFQSIDLRAFPAPVDALKDDERSFSLAVVCHEK